MSDMSASVILKLVDQLTGPAKKAAGSIKSLVKDLEKMQKLSGRKSSGANRQFESVAREAKKAAEAAKTLNKVMSRPIGKSFAKPAIASINGVATAANRATGAIQRMDRQLGRSGRLQPLTGRGSVTGGRSGHSARRAGGHAHSFGFASAFAHVGAYEVIEHGAREVAESVKTGLEQAFELAHSRVMLRMQGESTSAIDAATSQAKSMTKSLPQFTTAQNLEAIAELRPALLGGIEEATKLAPMFQHSIAVLEAVKQGAGKKALGGVDTHGEALSLVRALEVKNVTGLGDQAMQNYVDGITKAIVAFNGQIKAEDFHSAFKFSRGDSVNWSKEFSTEILPTLMNELKKSSKTDASMTGNALKSMSRVVMDGIMTPDAVGKWNGLHMFADGAMVKGRGGKLKKNPNFLGPAMVGGEVWQSNPFQWVQDYLLPHMKEHGVDLGNRKQVVAALGGLFGNRVANHIAQILATQQAIIKKDQQNVQKAMGTGGLNFLMGADPTTRMQVFAASLKELAGSMGEIGLSGTMRGMKGIIDWSHNLSERIGKSSYMKSLGTHFDSLVAGVFGQKIDDKASPGDKRYFGAGQILGKGFTDYTASLGKTVQWLEEIGAVSGTIEAVGAAFEGAAGACDLARDAAQGMTKAFTAGFAKNGVIDKLLSIVGLGQDDRDRVANKGAPRGHGRGAIVPSVPVEALVPSVPKAHMRGRGGQILDGEGWLDGFWRDTKKLMRSLSAPEPMGSAVTLDEILAPPRFNPVRPSLLTGALGGGLPTFAASGIKPQVSTEAATGQMTTLMSSLATIAGGGVTIAVNLNTAAAEAKLSSLVGRLNSIGAAGGQPQFNKALNDIN